MYRYSILCNKYALSEGTLLKCNVLHLVARGQGKGKMPCVSQIPKGDFRPKLDLSFAKGLFSRLTLYDVITCYAAVFDYIVIFSFEETQQWIV